MQVTDIRLSRYFPGPILFLGAVLGVIGVSIITSSVIAGTVLFIVSIVIFTTHYRFKIDLQKKEYFDYIWILGLKEGKKGKFEEIQYLFIKDSKVSQKMHIRVASTTVRKTIYDGYLKFSDYDKIHLMTRDSKAELHTALSKIAAKLNTRVVDYSENKHVEM